MSHDDRAPAGPAGWRLYAEVFAISAFILYLEMLVIRWVGTEIRIFAYLKNLTLIGCFLGGGVGCLVRHRRIPFVTTFPILAIFCALVALPPALGSHAHARLTQALGDFNEMPLWNWGAPGIDAGGMWLALFSLLLLFAIIVVLFVPAGRLLGLRLDACPHRASAYSANVGGSLVGVALFTLVSFLGWPPLAWFALTAGLGLLFVRGARALALGAGCTAIVAAIFLVPRVDATNVVWSPYQKLEYGPLYLEPVGQPKFLAGHVLTVNGTFYQRIVDLSPAFLARHADLWPEAADIDVMSYNLPYRLRPTPARVLVVGAGTGNDVAAALRNGAAHVDAVEIDPRIVALGRKLHPERPYDDPRVSVIVDDARAYFRQATAGYDLIVFGALDSHTVGSSMSNIRIDNYVYTVEAMRQARELLAPEGLLCLVFSLERPFIGERLFAILHDAFGHPPFVFDNASIRLLPGAGAGPTFLTNRAGTVPALLAAHPEVGARVQASRLGFTGAVVPATDDWPYLYLQRKTIPRVYRIVIAVLLVATLLWMRVFAGGWTRIDPVLFLTGAAFLLIEVQSVSKMALLFGTTWHVNAIVISAVFVTILLSNVVGGRVDERWLRALYAALAASLATNALFPFTALLPLATVPRALVSGAIMCAPVFFAGLIFIVLFARAAHADEALGSNLMGAIAGGLCESLSFVLGVNALSWVALAFYAGSLLLLRARRV